MRSVVVATHKGEKYIAQQLESILSQLDSHDEVVISDDASTDRTLETIARLADDRVRILANRTRVGYVANFQRAIAHCHGDRVYFSDQDDVWLPGKVEALDAQMQTHECVASDAIVVDERLQTLHPSYFQLRGARRFSHMAIYMKPSIIGATLACRRVYLESLLPFPAGVPHDFWLTLNAACDRTLGVLQRPLILYRRHGSALSVTASNRRRDIATIATERATLMREMLRRRLSRRFKLKGAHGGL